MCACLYVVADRVNEEEYREPEFDVEYREQEPEDQYREQELLEGFEDDKFNPILWCQFILCFTDTTYLPVLQIALFYRWNTVG